MDTRIVLIRSDGNTDGAGSFDMVFDGTNGERLAGRVKQWLVADIAVPSVLPHFLDDPLEYLPETLPRHSVVIAVNIHDEILLALPGPVKAASGRAIIVPRENPTWTSTWVRSKMRSKCHARGIEVVFPKPFCSLEEDDWHPAINKVIYDLRIGRPNIRIKKANGIVKEVEVLRSAPYGNTWYVAQNLKGKPVAEAETWAFKFWSTCPCLGAMVFDPDYNDLLQHVAGHILLDEMHGVLGRV